MGPPDKPKGSFSWPEWLCLRSVIAIGQRVITVCLPPLALQTQFLPRHVMFSRLIRHLYDRDRRLIRVGHMTSSLWPLFGGFAWGIPRSYIMTQTRSVCVAVETISGATDLTTNAPYAVRAGSGGRDGPVDSARVLPQRSLLYSLYTTTLERFFKHWCYVIPFHSFSPWFFCFY